MHRKKKDNQFPRCSHDTNKDQTVANITSSEKQELQTMTMMTNSKCTLIHYLTNTILIWPREIPDLPRFQSGLRYIHNCLDCVRMLNRLIGKFLKYGSNNLWDKYIVLTFILNHLNNHLDKLIKPIPQLCLALYHLQKIPSERKQCQQRNSIVVFSMYTK